MSYNKIISSAQQIVMAQARAVKIWHEKKPLSANDEFINLVLKEHRHNYELWHQEDEARRRNAGDSIIAEVKRTIDALNQKRNDAIERIDDFIIRKFDIDDTAKDEDLPMNSETPGSIIDRLSILALRIYHMDEEIMREEAAEEHREKCRARMVVLKSQEADLAEALHDLLAAVYRREKRLKVYHQFKMYNDEQLNPALYRNSN